MNGAFLLAGASLAFVLAYIVYGRYLVRLFGVDGGRETPASYRRDGVDYVPAKLPVLFGHHFASIAGAGPIVGPVAAAYFGWGPVFLWVVIGCIFIGAMHDFAALFVSVRADGRSIGHVIEQYIGYSGRQIFLIFSWAALILVVAVFGVLVAETFVANPAAATASLLFIAMSPFFGYLVYRRNVSILAASFVFVPLLFLFVWVGSAFPCDLVRIATLSGDTARKTWLVFLFVYIFIASVLPVWMLLQPRDYLNSYLLYGMMIAGVAGIMLARPDIQAPFFEGWSVVNAGTVSSVFPILFVTVACGACSGFHALVASGTTAKQLSSEKHILPVAYGAMLVEGVLAVMALVSVAYLAPADMAETIRRDGPVVAFASGLAHFCETLRINPETGRNFFTLAISAFLLTTLDTATRLARFAWQELFILPDGDEPAVAKMRGFWSNRYMATLCVIAGAGFLVLMERTGADGSVIPAWKIIWPVFGASNQLLAALTLLVLTVILMRQKKKFAVTLFPMIFMMLVCFMALWNLMMDNLRAATVNWAIVVAAAFLFVMAVVLVVQSFLALRRTGLNGGKK